MIMNSRRIRYIIGIIVVVILASMAVKPLYQWGIRPFLLDYRPPYLLNYRPVPVRPPLIMHAGGEYMGETYTNSLEALNNSYSAGHRYFEIDFCWTRDSELVCIHDWKETYKTKFLAPPSGVPSLDEFLQLKMKKGMHQLSLKSLISWLSSKPDAFIVTDVKTENIKALTVIATDYSNYKKQFIPQVYQPSEIKPTRALGFKDIIFTIYRCRLSQRRMLEQIAGKDLFAVTLPSSRAAFWNFAANLKHGGFYTYAHTVNSQGEWDSLKNFGICGVYSDSLPPPKKKHDKIVE